MSKPDYTAMSDRELKQYLLTHRDDQQAFYAYMDRRHARPRRAPIPLDDPGWQDKVISVVQDQLDCSA